MINMDHEHPDKLMMSFPPVESNKLEKAMSQDEKLQIFYNGKDLPTTSRSTSDQQLTNSNAMKSSAESTETSMTQLQLPSLSVLSGGSSSGTSSNGMVTALISSKPLNINQSIPSSSSSNQQLLLPKPNMHRKIITTASSATPTKISSNSSALSLSSSLHSSPNQSQSWQGTGTPLNRKRVLAEFDSETYDSKRRRTTPNRCAPEKGGGKGLRHFSMKVCEKVQQKGVTSYNEVANELVQEFTNQCIKFPISEQPYDQKNIRRRVYDALNVLMAMNIISKEKKEIKWVGLPTNSSQECKHLEEQKQQQIERIRQKQQQLKELIVQQVAYKNLVERNKKMEKKNGPPQANACIHLPFIVVNTSRKTVIDCSISSDKSEYLFNFDEAFEIHDDIEVLKRMGLSFGLEKGVVTEKDLKLAKTMVPKSLEPYLLQMANGTYGDIDLIDYGGRKPFLTESFTSVLSPGSSHKFSSQKKLLQLTSSVQNTKRIESSVSSPSVGSGYDSDNDRDDENSAII